MRKAIIGVLMLASACMAEERGDMGSGNSSKGEGGRVATAWQLISIDGTPYEARASLSLDGTASLSGRGPCNSFGARQEASLPDLRITSLFATRRMCPEIDAERRYFDMLKRMTRAEETAAGLVLTGGGHRMVFTKP